MGHLASVISLIVLTVSVLLSGCGSAAPAETAAVTTTITQNSPAVTATTETTPNATTLPPATAAATSSPMATPTATATVSATPSATAAPAGYTATDPVSAFTAGDIAFLGLDGLAGTPRQIADAIRTWQENTWAYVSGTPGYEDVSDPIRWNYFLPGIFPSRDIVREQVRNGQIYGICYSYAVAYCSVANYYGLETRILASISKPSDSDPSITITTGMSPDEYDRLAVKLAQQGAHYDYEAVRLVAQETPTHYWAEVKLDGQWVIEDATQRATGNDTRATFFDTGDYEVYDWTAFDRSGQLDEYQAMIDKGERLPDSGGGSFPGGGMPTATATGIDEVMTGQGLAPWFADAADAYDFIGATNVSAADIAEDQYVIDEYERQTGDRFYLVAALIAEDGPASEFADRYEALCGVKLNLTVFLSIGGGY